MSLIWLLLQQHGHLVADMWCKCENANIMLLSYKNGLLGNRIRLIPGHLPFEVLQLKPWDSRRGSCWRDYILLEGLHTIWPDPHEELKGAAMKMDICNIRTATATCDL